MRSFLRVGALTLALVFASSSSAGAQVIRGAVTEVGSGAPLAGALVTLRHVASADDSGAAVRSAVTNQRGEYALTAPGAGRYRLTVRRIGVRAWASAVLTVSAGETTTQDAALDPFTATSLPRVTVTDRSLCTSGRDRLRVVGLWREAQTALTVIAISASDSSLRRRMVRFTRRMGLFSPEIIEESHHSYDQNDGIGEPAFRSLGGDSLSQAGYLVDADNDITFYAPDASALLSGAFLRDHCFSIAERQRDRPGLVGLAFAPVRSRTTPDIRGTLWLDSASYELRFVEFRWTQLPRELQHDRVGGEVYFTRLPTGHWIVKNWTLTMPRPSRVQFRSLGGPRRERLMIDGLGQEGGMILIHGLETFDKPGTVTGTIARSGKPLTWTRIRLVGTPFRTIVDSSGRFRFDSVPPGLHSIVAEHPDFEVFGIRAAEEEFVLQEGATRHLVFRAPGEKEIADAMCPHRDWRLPTLHVALLDERSGRPLRGTRLRLRWIDVVTERRGDLFAKVPRERDLDATTDDLGNAVFCSVPAERTLTLGYPVDAGLYPLHTFKLGTQENAVATLRVSPL
jgi:hypothetical protein